MTPDLLPCPICGKMPAKVTYDHSVWFVCQEMGNHLITHRIEAAGKTEEEAVQAWNRRYTPDKAFTGAV